MNAMNRTLEAMEIPVVMTREDWEKEYAEEYKKECIRKIRKYFKRKLIKVIRAIIDAIKIIIAAAIFYGVMCVIAIFVEWICTSVWI